MFAVRTLIRSLGCLVLALSLSWSSVVHAGPSSLAADRREAMEAYQRSDLRTAKKLLRKALRHAKRYHVRGRELAEIYVAIGIVNAASPNGHSRAVNAFRHALSADPTVRPDPQVASPEASSAYRAALHAREAGEREPEDDEDEPEEGEADEDEAEEAPAAPSRPLSRREERAARRAERAARRAERAARSDEASGAFRDAAPSAPEPQTAPASPVPETPSTIVRPLRQDDLAEAAPGPREEEPSEDRCTEQGDCTWGLACIEGFCRQPPPEQVEKERPKRATGFFQLGFGVAATSLSRGSAPDRYPSTAQLDQIRDASSPTGTLDLEQAQRTLRSQGWDCEPVEKDGSLKVTDCSVSADPGLVAEPLLGMAFGFYVHPRLALALTGDIELSRGRGPFAGMMIGGRIEYVFTQPLSEGLQLSGLLGGGIGALQVRSRQVPSGGPRATHSGLDAIGYGVSAGLKALYRADEHWAFGITPSVQIGLPNTMVIMNATLGAEFDF